MVDTVAHIAEPLARDAGGRHRPGGQHNGNATAAHLASAVFLNRAGLDITHVPYRGGTPALQDLLGGNIAFVSYANKIVTVQLQGACSGCPSSTLTLQSGIKNILQRMLPTLIDDVVAA